MQIDQLFEFVYILIDKKQVTAKDMAQRFGVSVRTIYRWIDALCISGVPIYSLKGRGGGIAISDKYAMDNTILSEEERLAIVSSVKALNALSGNPASLVNANIKAAEKISGLVASNTDWLQVDFAPWSPEGSDIRNLFSILRDSILKKRQVTFDYFTGDGRSENRRVHPWKLVFRGQSWYLLGWCSSRKAERYFKLTRMRNVNMTGAALTIKENSPSAIEKRYENQSGPSQKNNSPDSLSSSSYKYPLITIKAKVAKEKISYLLDSFICSELITHRDGKVTASFTAPDTPWLCELLLSFGPDLKVLSPKRVREKIIQLAASVTMLYKK